MALSTVIFQVLRLQTNAREWIKLTALANRRQPIEHDVRMKPAAVTELYARSDDTIRPDLAPGTDLRA